MAKLKIKLDLSLSRLDLVVKGMTSTKFLGNYASAFKGTGLEFADYRKYTQGVDDASLIDWKASRRSNDLLVKEFVEERNLEIIFLVDVSNPMLTGSAKKLKAEYIAEMVSSLGYSMLSAGDSVGLILFSNKIVNFIPPKLGLKQFYSLTKNLSDISNYGGYSNIDNAIDFVFKNGLDNALVILISDFIYGLNSVKNLRLATRKFDFISVLVRDPRDMTLPEGIGEVVVQDPYSGETMLLDPKKVGKPYSRDTKLEVAKIRKVMENSGADFLFLQTDKPYIKEVIKFFKRRES